MVVVWEVPDIKKGFLAESQVPGEEGLYRLKTEGVNMQVYTLWYLLSFTSIIYIGTMEAF